MATEAKEVDNPTEAEKAVKEEVEIDRTPLTFNSDHKYNRTLGILITKFKWIIVADNYPIKYQATKSLDLN